MCKINEKHKSCETLLFSLKEKNDVLIKNFESHKSSSSSSGNVEKQQHDHTTLIEKLRESDANRVKLKNECKELVKRNEWLTIAIRKFEHGSKAFNMLLASQKCIFDKRGLGYKDAKKEKLYMNYFVKEGASENESTTCNFCGRKGHISSSCKLKVGSSSNVIKTRVIKEIKTNHKGPKKVWVPKVS